jgi:class 3 adenylate cyclase
MELQMSEQRRLAAIMFTDICGFSTIMGADEERALAIVDMHKNCVADGARIHDGRIAKEMGDGLLVEFPSAVNAVRCALAVQRAISDFNKTADPEEKFQLRIGIHVGDVVVAGDDILGDGVNVASRIEPLAEPGGICISRDIFDLVRNKISIETVHLGAHDLKNISRQVSIYKVLIDAVAPGVIAAPKIAKPRPISRYAVIAALALMPLVAGVAIWKYPNRATRTEPVEIHTAPAASRTAPATIPADNAASSLRERHFHFIKAILEKRRQEALAFVHPDVLANGNPDLIWRRMTVISGILHAGQTSRDDLKLKAVNLADDGRSAAIHMQIHLPAFNGKPEQWKDIKPVSWRKIDDTWYLDIDANMASMPATRPGRPDRRHFEEQERDSAIPRNRQPPR